MRDLKCEDWFRQTGNGRATMHEMLQNFRQTKVCCLGERTLKPGGKGADGSDSKAHCVHCEPPYVSGYQTHHCQHC